MEAITLEHALENKFTPIDCIKYFKPEWTDEECDFYLWGFIGSVMPSCFLTN